MRAPSNANAPGAVLDLPRHLSQHATAYVASAALLAGGYVLLAPVLDYLYRAVKARRPEVPGVARVTAYAGPALLVLGWGLRGVVPVGTFRMRRGVPAQLRRSHARGERRDRHHLPRAWLSPRRAPGGRWGRAARPRRR